MYDKECGGPNNGLPRHPCPKYLESVNMTCNKELKLPVELRLPVN